MSCQQIQQHLNDYLDDELSREIRESVREHLGECLVCRRELEELRALVDRAGKLKAEIQPARDLWPGVRARLVTSQDAEHPWWLQLAAAGITILVLSVPFSVWWVGRQDTEARPHAQAGRETESVSVQAELARSEDGVLLARTDLLTAIERHRDVIEDDALRNLEDSMNILDRAIGELRAALDEDPYNLRLRMLLASRYQQERRLLQRVSRV